MREFWILTKLQLTSLFGINKILHMKNAEDKKQAKRGIYSLIAMVFAMGYMSVFYSIMLANAFEMMGQLPMLLGLMAFASSALILVFSIFETKGVLFGFGDYDIQMSWPVSVHAVAASRVTTMYAYNFVYAAMLLIPAGVVYAVKAAPTFWFYPTFLLVTLLLPAVPTIIGGLLGTLMTIATAGMKKRNIANIFAQLLLVFVIMFFSFRMNTGIADPEKLAAGASALQSSVSGVYPPAQWFQDALTGGSALNVLWLLLLTVVSIALLLLFVGKYFIAVNSRIKSQPKGEKFVMRGQVRSSSTTALFKNEWRRYLSSSLYVVNTAFGYLMLLGAGVFCLIKPDMIVSVLNMPETGFLRLLVPFILGWILSMSATTSSAISMEGKRLWIVKSMPVPARDWLTSKLMVSLVLAVPSVLIACTMISIGLRSDAAGWFWNYVIPLLYAVAFSVYGLWLNIRMPRLDWQNEAEVVKQSGSVMISVFVGMGVAAAPAILIGITQSKWVTPLTALVLLGLTLAMWQSLMKSGDKRLYKLN